MTADERDKVIMHMTENAEIALQMMQLVRLLEFISQCIHSVSVCRAIEELPPKGVILSPVF